ncbi:MAG: hypothetical protein Q4Q20_04780 [Methanocorpusculum sp.]|nr:hypothetical protein [Methanocorpusculum sp.]
MREDDGVSTTAAVILLIGITVLLGGVIVFAISTAGLPDAAQKIPAKLTVSGDTGILSIPEGYGIEHIIISTAYGESVYSPVSGDGECTVYLPKENIASPASVTAEFPDGTRTVILQI